MWSYDIKYKDISLTYKIKVWLKCGFIKNEMFPFVNKIIKTVCKT